MFERFTERARKVLQLANQEAQRLNHEFIGTEHLLLGLVKEGSGVAANVLKNLDVDLKKIRIEVEKLVQPGPEVVTIGRLPQTPAPRRRPNTPSKRPGISITTTSEQNTCYWASCANRKVWRLRF